MKTLEQYLKENAEKGIIDFRIRTNVNGEFYIHPMNASGETLDFKAEGNALVPKVTV